MNGPSIDDLRHAARTIEQLNKQPGRAEDAPAWTAQELRHRAKLIETQRDQMVSTLMAFRQSDNGHLMSDSATAEVADYLIDQGWRRS